MNQELIDAAVELADALARENEALSRLDLARAAAMLGAKRRAAAGFDQARTALLNARGPQVPGAEAPSRTPQALAPEVERRLAALAEENRHLLERAIRVQRRIIGTVASALPRADAAHGYRPDGAPVTGRRTPAFALSARA